MYGCFVWMYAYAPCTHPPKLEEDVRSTRTGVQMGVTCHVDAGNWIQILWMSRGL